MTKKLVKFLSRKIDELLRIFKNLIVVSINNTDNWEKMPFKTWDSIRSLY